MDEHAVEHITASEALAIVVKGGAVATQSGYSVTVRLFCIRTGDPGDDYLSTAEQPRVKGVGSRSNECNTKGHHEREDNL